MTMDAGNAACTTGLSKRIYDARVAVASTIGITSDPAGHGPLKADCYAIATAIVAELTDNAEAVITTTTAGLQTSSAVGSPTAPPAPTEKTLRIR
jgi:hypothetical protein